MITLGTPATINDKKLRVLETSLATLLAQVLRAGFHGTMAVEVSVQDGTIQHVRTRMERIQK